MMNPQPHESGLKIAVSMFVIGVMLFTLGWAFRWRGLRNFGAALAIAGVLIGAALVDPNTPQPLNPPIK